MSDGSSEIFSAILVEHMAFFWFFQTDLLHHADFGQL
jgi:hypothetical protein